MNQLPFYWVDAFSNKRFGGNPCAVILDADHLSTETMQIVAKEIGLSETAFIKKSNIADFSARYFTPERELPFAGHPTIATVSALISSGLVGEKKTNISLELPAGLIPIKISRGQGQTKITMSQLTPQFLRKYDPQDILAIYGLDSDDLLRGVPIQTVSTGTPVLMIPLSHRDALKKVSYVDSNRYLSLRDQGDFLYAHHFCLQGATSKGSTFARGLGEPPDGKEDPFTGSSTGCMAGFLWKYNLIETPSFIAEQGHWMNRPGEAEVQVIGDRDAIETIFVSGGGVTIMTGKINI